MIFYSVHFSYLIIFAQSLPKSYVNHYQYQLTIIHVNDIHAHFEEVSINATRCRSDLDDCYGGVARMQAKKKQILSQDPEALFLNAGDFYQGFIIRDMWKY